jgi:hypothetical protein
MSLWLRFTHHGLPIPACLKRRDLWYSGPMQCKVYFSKGKGKAGQTKALMGSFRRFWAQMVRCLIKSCIVFFGGASFLQLPDS